MTRDPKRLLEEGSGRERELLRSAHGDAPSRGAEQKAMIALGLTAPLIHLPGPETATPAAAPATAASIKVIGALKIASMVAAVAGAGTASWLALREPEPEAIQAPAPVVLPQPEPAPMPEPEAEVAPDVAPDTIPEPPPKPPTRRARPILKPQPTLQLELELIRSAKAHLAEGDAEAASADLQRYEREIGRGTLFEEAAVLAIEAAFAAQAPDARGRAEEFLSELPNSPHAARVRALLEHPP